MSQSEPFPLALTGPGGVGGAHPDCPPALRDALAADPAAFFDRGTPVKRSRRTAVARVEGASVRVAVKRYACGAWRRRLGLGRARRAAFRLVQLRAAGVPAVAPLAWIEGAAGGFLVAPWLDDAVGADRALRGAAPTLRRRTTQGLAACVARLHRAGFVHRDLKAANVLVGARGATLVDVDGARRAPLAGAERRARDVRRLWRSLVALAPSRADCRRFGQAYAQALGDAAAAGRVWAALAAEDAP